MEKGASGSSVAWARENPSPSPASTSPQCPSPYTHQGSALTFPVKTQNPGVPEPSWRPTVQELVLRTAFRKGTAQGQPGSGLAGPTPWVRAGFEPQTERRQRPRGHPRGVSGRTRQTRMCSSKGDRPDDFFIMRITGVTLLVILLTTESI